VNECPVINCSKQSDGFHDLQDHLQEDHGKLVPTETVMEWVEEQERQLREALE